MATPALPNKWHLRRVADKSAKACWICYKLSSNVLITPNNKDFFYICQGHLKDRTFCIPDEAEAAALKEKKEKKEKEELEKETAKVIAEHEEKKKAREKRKEERKRAKEKEKGKGKDKEKAEKDDKKDDKKDEEEDKKDGEEMERKIKELDKKTESVIDDLPRIYSLQKSFYNKRLSRIRNAEMAKRTQEMIRNPSSFPSVPMGDPSKP